MDSEGALRCGGCGCCTSVIPLFFCTAPPSPALPPLYRLADGIRRAITDDLLDPSVWPRTAVASTEGGSRGFCGHSAHCAAVSGSGGTIGILKFPLPRTLSRCSRPRCSSQTGAWRRPRRRSWRSALRCCCSRTCRTPGGSTGRRRHPRYRDPEHTWVAENLAKKMDRHRASPGLARRPRCYSSGAGLVFGGRRRSRTLS
jgi:hypothetical protein